MTEQESELHALGAIIGTHGLKGGLKVRTHPEDAAALLDLQQVWLGETAANAGQWRIRAVQLRKGFLLMQLKGCEHVSSAAALVGQSLFVAPEELQRPEGRRFWFELSGLQVVDRQRGDIGQLEDMFTTAAHPILVVQGPLGEIMIPAVPQFITEYDLVGGKILVDLPEGLYPES